MLSYLSALLPPKSNNLCLNFIVCTRSWLPKVVAWILCSAGLSEWRMEGDVHFNFCFLFFSFFPLKRKSLFTEWDRLTRLVFSLPYILHLGIKLHNLDRGRGNAQRLQSRSGQGTRECRAQVPWGSTISQRPALCHFVRPLCECTSCWTKSVKIGGDGRSEVEIKILTDGSRLNSLSLSHMRHHIICMFYTALPLLILLQQRRSFARSLKKFSNIWMTGRLVQTLLSSTRYIWVSEDIYVYIYAYVRESLRVQNSEKDSE